MSKDPREELTKVGNDLLNALYAHKMLHEKYAHLNDKMSSFTSEAGAMMGILADGETMVQVVAFMVEDEVCHADIESTRDKYLTMRSTIEAMEASHAERKAHFFDEVPEGVDYKPSEDPYNHD